MFDLEKEVQSWRASLPLEMRDRRDQVDELEQHVRDAFEARIAAGDSAEIAWNAAIASLGPVPQIAGEFQKLNRAWRIWIPAWLALGAMAIIVVALIVCFVFANGLGPRVERIRAQPMLATHVVLITIGYCAMFAIGFVVATAVVSRAWFGWDDERHLSLRQTGELLAGVVIGTILPGTLLGAIWARDHMGRWWGWDPKEIGGLCVLVWAVILFKSFASRGTPPQVLMLLGVIGNVVVAVSWFGPGLLLSGHGYGQPSPGVGATFAGFLVLQMALVYLALLPEGGTRVRRG